MPSPRFLLALCLVAAPVVHACTLPDYVYDDDALSRLNQGGGGGATAGSGTTAGAAGSRAGAAGSRAGTSGSSGHSEGGAGAGAGPAGAGGDSGESGASGEGPGGSSGGEAGEAGQAGESGSAGAAGMSGSSGHGGSSGGTTAGTSGTAGVGGTSAGTSSGGTSGGTAGKGGTTSTGGTGGTAGKGGTGGTSAGMSGAGGGGPTGCVVKSYNFSGCNDGFNAATGKSKWQCGKPTVGPKADHTTGSGTVWATRLDGKPQMCDDSTLESPSIDLSSHAGKPVKLSFWSWSAFRGCDKTADFGTNICDLECALVNDSYSGGALEVLVNGTWTVVAPTGGYGTSGGQSLYVNGSTKDANDNPKPPCQTSTLDDQKVFASSGPSLQWKQWTFDVSGYLTSDFRFRLHFASAPDEDICFPNTSGWFIDDLEIGYSSACP